MTRFQVRTREGVLAAELVVARTGLTVVRCSDVVLGRLLVELAAAPDLPAATRTPLAGGGHAVGVKRLKPADAGYAEAVAGAIARKGPWRCEEA